ncbi:unnamed protein product [Rangifer tarandus platyrhynchus]|uniref:Uncharacterized protein n=2 Tax=Rangifer tarandus platyrhynchus TaxID=3082113 RepID=A0AC60A6G5_RANTA|nr:unnamed protein product [Rangifer tarandus platyrhynchus]
MRLETGPQLPLSEPSATAVFVGRAEPVCSLCPPCALTASGGPVTTPKNLLVRRLETCPEKAAVVDAEVFRFCARIKMEVFELSSFISSVFTSLFSGRSWE